MAKIGIPSPVFPGFKLISELNEDQMNTVLGYISELPIDIEFDEVAKELDRVLEQRIGKVFLRTLLSFTELIVEDVEEQQKITQNLVESYIELSKDKLSKERRNILQSNLYKILSNYNSIKDILHFRKNYFESENNISGINLITDLRLVFKENLEDKNRAAIILHKLHLEYRNQDESLKTFITLDVDDLNNLKAQIEKAIEKEQVIREDYKDFLKFIS